jgi:hypothetical protein
MDLHGVRARNIGIYGFVSFGSRVLEQFVLLVEDVSYRMDLSLSHPRPKKGSGDAYTKLFYLLRDIKWQLIQETVGLTNTDPKE